MAHLAECGECRKAVFLMQPQKEPQRVRATPEKRWTWRWLVPVGVPAVLACALIAVLVHTWPHGGAPQQVASVKPGEMERPATSIPPTLNVDKAAPTANPEGDARSRGQQNGPVPKSAADVTGQTRGARGASLRALKKEQVGPGAAAQMIAAAPSASAQTADPALAQSVIGSSTVSELPLNGRNVMELQQLSAQAGTSGISGRITDRTGAVIAGVTVTMRDAAGKTRQTTTGADGTFSLSNLPAGQYSLTSAAIGFKTNLQSIELKPSELAKLQPQLDVGSVSAAVEVTGSAPSLQTESASVSGQMAHGATPSEQPILATVSQGKRVLSLDSMGDLFLSRDEGKKWKKVKPRWTGKAIRIELTSGSGSETAQKQKDETPVLVGKKGVFLLTTDGGAVWSSKDGAHWHQQ